MAGEGGQAEGVFRVAGFTFFSDFDSGNLGDVRQDEEEAEEEQEEVEGEEAPRPSTSGGLGRSVGSDSADYRFLVWTRPDCQGTEFENGNRTWFYFGMKGGPPGAVVQFTLQNLNKQNKLFSQGMSPVVQVGGRPGWERVRDPPTYWVTEGAFYMSFKFRCLEEAGSLVYFAFTFPYTYRELQSTLGRLERKHGNGGQAFAALQQLPDTAIYFHRELVTSSLEGRRLDLLTITGTNAMARQREPAPSGLFPEAAATPRSHRFPGKKVIFLSARVHPGETCSSYVMLGILRFLLQDKDPRAASLRRKYVFQLLPMLNPDGVYRGHYRTDTRGVNLNRVYAAPSPALHPTIFAARRLVLLAHLGEDVAEEQPVEEAKKVEEEEEEVGMVEEVALPPALPLPSPADTFQDWYRPQSVWQQGRGRGRSSNSSRVSNSSRASSVSISSHLPTISPTKPRHDAPWYEMTDTSRCSEGDESVADFSLPSKPAWLPPLQDDAAFLPPDLAPPANSRTNFSGAFKPQPPEKAVQEGREEQAEEEVPLYRPRGDTGLFLYVDIHGHASKRGIFMYGNHFDDLETKISALLFPKLMSINSANFDFPACNFTQRNMFMKDRHTGAGREGSGRVSVYRATGLTYCYTLECNFNTGRHTNTVPPASRDGGRASPPAVLDSPPRYSPVVYEECGKYLAVSILDLTESNPWTRLPCSPCTTLKGVRQWIKQYIKSAEAESAAKASKAASKASPMRTRLRSLSSGPRRSPAKQLKVPASAGADPSALPLPKVARKAAMSPRNLVPKLGRQNSRSKSAKAASEGGVKKTKRSVSSAKKASSTSATRPSSKTGGSRAGSRSNSRASSPRLTRLEPKVTKLGLTKKALQKSAWKSVEEAAALPTSSTVDTILPAVKKTKRKKKRVLPIVP